MSDVYATPMECAHHAFLETQRENTFRDEQSDPLRAAISAFLLEYARHFVASEYTSEYLTDLAAHLSDTEAVRRLA